eukprot:CAMPEP_0184859608 /NCGR_PEP_ID=MMETSP0580-20130426/4600_1 /TAXON_ID=1118495 /ORGANISM="Dactyliosolen fragilissimus" /LENGTH=841 /DNA_ID=CAMNT_0027356345 /DNA_START=15 /DNA_END=2537 /DNA_ORIENTATION=+
MSTLHNPYTSRNHVKCTNHHKLIDDGPIQKENDPPSDCDSSQPSSMIPYATRYEHLSLEATHLRTLDFNTVAENEEGDKEDRTNTTTTNNKNDHNNNNSGNGNNSEKQNLKDRHGIAAMAHATNRAAMMCMLQSAIYENESSTKETNPEMMALLALREKTRLDYDYYDDIEIDNTERKGKTLLGMAKLCGISASRRCQSFALPEPPQYNKNNGQDCLRHLDKDHDEDEKYDDNDVEDFFQLYTECVRKNDLYSDYHDEDVGDSDSSDDDNYTYDNFRNPCRSDVATQTHTLHKDNTKYQDMKIDTKVFHQQQKHQNQQKQQQQQQQHSYKHTSSWNTYETSKRQEHNHDFALDENDMPPPSTNANPFRSARECITKPNHHTGYENGAPEDSNLQYNNSSQLQNHHGMGQSSIPTQSTQQHLLSTHHESNNPYFQGNNQYQNFINTTSQTTLQSQQHQSRNINNNNRANISAGLKRKFQPPKPRNGNSQGRGNNKQESNGGGGIQSAYSSNNPSKKSNDDKNDDDLPEELAHLDKQLVEKIMSEIIDNGDKITFDDIAGLADAKQTVMELVCWPMKRPDLFTGLRRGPNGLLLFGPPGTGKTLIGKAIAHESGATFFSISSSSLTSKWIGEGEKLVRTLFAVAAYKEPAVVFIDEIDSMLTQRKADENEASRRIKTEFLVQLDGTSTSGQGRVLVIGATNRPHELDDAARRRFVKRLYIPLPERADREVLLQTLLAKNSHSLTEKDIIKLSSETDGYSGADLKALCTDAALGPIRQLGRRALEVNAGEVPPISYRHFKHALRGMNPSVSQDDLFIYLEWNKTYGSKSVTADDYNGIRLTGVK